MKASLLATLLVACAPSGPPIEECSWGRYYADCGANGGGEPVVACDQATGECRFFAGGLVAAGYVASSCPLDNLCCQPASGSMAGWPFAGWAPSGDILQRAQDDIDLLRVTWPISSSSPEGFPVTLDYDETPAEVQIECEPGYVLGYQATTDLPAHVELRRHGDSLMLAITQSTYIREYVEIEVWPGPDGLEARLFKHERGALDVPQAVSCVESTGYFIPAVGSTLRLSPDAMTSPESAHGVLDLVLMDPALWAGHMTVTF